MLRTFSKFFLCALKCLHSTKNDSLTLSRTILYIKKLLILQSHLALLFSLCFLQPWRIGHPFWLEITPHFCLITFDPWFKFQFNCHFPRKPTVVFSMWAIMCCWAKKMCWLPSELAHCLAHSRY